MSRRPFAVAWTTDRPASWTTRSRRTSPSPYDMRATPLNSAAAAGAREVAVVLLQAGADDDGRTPADLAEECGHPEVAARLGSG